MIGHCSVYSLSPPNWVKTLFTNQLYLSLPCSDTTTKYCHLVVKLYSFIFKYAFFGIIMVQLWSLYLNWVSPSLIVFLYTDAVIIIIRPKLLYSILFKPLMDCFVHLLVTATYFLAPVKQYITCVCTNCVGITYLREQACEHIYFMPTMIWCVQHIK